MVRVLSLLWTMVAAFLTSGLSFFYLNENGTRHGFPFGFATESVKEGNVVLNYSIISYIFDLIFWWFLFSILLIVVKNYIFEAD